MTTESNSAINAAMPNFGRYVPQRLIGEGAMGRVFLAQDPVLQRDVAVKVVSIEQKLDRQTHEEFLKRFALEARASAKLHHQSIVTVYDAGQQDGRPWIAFEYVDGERLDEVLARERPLPIDRAVGITLDIAAALQHAHNFGIIHRDIKPANILIDKRTAVSKLSDFGIVKAPWTGLTQDGMIVGSPGYMSPEQVNGSELDGRSDLFSLGVVLYEMVTGKHPFVREDVQATLMATLAGTYVPARTLCPDAPRGLETFLERCLASDRDKRIASAQDFIALLTSEKWIRSYASLQTRIGSIKTGFDKPPTAGTRAIKKETTRLLKAAVESGKKAGEIIVESAGNLRHIAIFCSRQAAKIFRTKKDETGAAADAGEPGRHAKAARDGASIILQQTGGVLSRIFGRIASVKKSTWAMMVIIAVAAVVPIAAVIITLKLNVSDEKLLEQVKSRNLAESLKAAQKLHERGVAWPVENLVQRGKKYAEADNIELASLVAENLNEMADHLPQTQILMGRVALKSGEYEDARDAFLNARDLKGGRALLEQEHIAILTDLSRELMQRKASKALINMAIKVLTDDDEPVVRSWTLSNNYWLRWNSVQLLEAGDKHVDLVTVYLIDLQSGPDVDTRVRAAIKLGEFLDPRAVPMLKQAAIEEERTGGQQDVAKAARLALHKYSR